MKLNLSNITSGYGAVAALNANFDAIEAAVENTLSRDGTTPNEMLANLDMNGNDILNANAVDVASLTINGTPVQPATGVTVASAFQSYTFTATLGQTSFSVSPYTPYVASVQVEVNGLSLPPAEISVSGTNVVIPACSAGDEVVIRRYTDAPSPFPVANDITFNQAGTVQTRSVQSKLRDVVSVKDFGAVGNGIADDTTAIWNSIISLRANPVSILDTIGGSTITAYSSGVVQFPPGIYKVSADQLKIYQDVGLTLKGSGSRRTNNAVRASTTLLISGTSSGFGIQAYRSGGRGLTIEDMDICYETSSFTGSVLDVYDSPGVTCNRVFFGTYGITGGTRIQTAAACVRSTYDEFMTFNNCVFDGAVDGWWSDDTRIALGNSFGGSNTFFNNCVFYDFTGSQVRHDGNRTRTGVSLYGCALNPISVNCLRSVNFTNIEGLCIDTNHFVPSTTFKASTEWMKVSNCTGSIVNNTFDDLSKAGTIDGMLDISGNRVFSTDGFTATGGVLTGRSNEFSQGTNGWTISPTYAICVDLGPDLFKVGITGRSYDIPTDSINLAGRISYDSANDSSVSKFRNTSGRIQIQNVDGKSFSVSSTPYTVSILDTGRTILATGGSAQTFTLPTPTPGTTITITKLSSVNLNINCAGGTNYYGVGTSAYTGAALTGATYGTLVLEAYATVGWIVKSQVNSWTFT